MRSDGLVATLGRRHCPSVSPLFRACYARPQIIGGYASGPPAASHRRVRRRPARREPLRWRLVTAPKQAPTAAAPALPSLLRRVAALMADWVLCLLAAGLVANPRQIPWPPVAILVAEYGFFIGLFSQ